MRESYVTPSITKMLYGWTKWGGSRLGIFREFGEEWSCQICGKKQIIGLPQYFFPLDDSRRDFLRVCASCWHDLLEAGIRTHQELEGRIGIEKFQEEIRLKMASIESELKTSLEDNL